MNVSWNKGIVVKVGIRKDVADSINKESMNKSICKKVYPRF